MASDLIGMARCPLCGGRARLGLAKNQLPVMTMNCCNAQLFARSDRSDSLLRGMLLPADDTPEPKKPAPAPLAAVPTTVQAPTVTPVRPAPPESVRTGEPKAENVFGLMKW